MSRVVVSLVALALALSACGGKEIAPPTPPGDDSDQRAAGATVLLRSLARGLERRDRSAVAALAAPDNDSRRAVSAIYANAGALHLSDIAFRFVTADDAPATGLAARRYAGDAWSATVTASWRLSGFDRAVTRSEVSLVLITRGGQTRLTGLGAGGDRSPLWLAAPLTVAQDGSALVMSAGRTAAGYLPLADRAVHDVRRVLPRWRDRLVVEVADSERRLERALSADAGQYRAIAGVTTTVDGSLAPGSPVHVFLNPEVFDDLGPQGAQVVLSHESTHVAVRAPFATMPTWLVEGFADYVALRHARVPLTTAARQIIARVRKDGPPTMLPTTQSLDPSAPGLGATYEEAWTICRLIGQDYGQVKMVAFYDAVDRGADTASAFRAVLGTTEPEFVRVWSADLAAIAGGGPTA